MSRGLCSREGLLAAELRRGAEPLGAGGGADVGHRGPGRPVHDHRHGAGGRLGDRGRRGRGADEEAGASDGRASRAADAGVEARDLLAVLHQLALLLVEDQADRLELRVGVGPLRDERAGLRRLGLRGLGALRALGLAERLGDDRRDLGLVGLIEGVRRRGEAEAENEGGTSDDGLDGLDGLHCGPPVNESHVLPEQHCSAGQGERVINNVESSLALSYGLTSVESVLKNRYLHILSASKNPRFFITLSR